MGVKIVVTQEKFDQVFSIDDWMNFGELSQKDIYEKILNFVVDDAGEPVTVEQARVMFKSVPKAEWIEHLNAFATAVKDAFVNPTNGGS